MKVLANDGLAASGIEQLESAGVEVVTQKVAQEQLANVINQEGYTALLVRSATTVRKELIDACPGLKFIGRGGVGMDNIDVDYARSKGLTVANTPAASSDSVAELVFAHLASGLRFLHDANRNMPLEGETKFKEMKKAYAKGRELRGKTMGIIGFGRIGQSVARIAIGQGMKVVAHDPFVENASIKLEFFDGQELNFDITTVSKEEVLKSSDFVTLHVPAQKDGYVIGKPEMEMMKDGAVLINAARGGVVDEHALLDALDADKLSFAGLDVFENEPKPAMRVLMNPALSLSPHIGAATVEAQARIGTEMAEAILSFRDAQ
mgnify:CR=1 FL=1